MVLGSVSRYPPANAAPRRLRGVGVSRRPRPGDFPSRTPEASLWPLDTIHNLCHTDLRPYEALIPRNADVIPQLTNTAPENLLLPPPVLVSEPN